MGQLRFSMFLELRVIRYAQGWRIERIFMASFSSHHRMQSICDVHLQFTSQGNLAAVRCKVIDDGVPVPDIARATYGEK